MAVTSYKNASVSSSEDNGLSTDWVNTSNAEGADDASYSTASPAKNGGVSDWLRLTGFGFTAGDIPSGSTIDGIELSIGKFHENGNCLDNGIFLRKTSGQVGDDKSKGTNWPTSDGDSDYGGGADTWNASLAQGDIVSADFGIDISCTNIDATGVKTSSVDYVQIRITYTPPAGGFSHDVGGVANANIGKIGGVAIADIAKVGGVE